MICPLTIYSEWVIEAAIQKTYSEWVIEAAILKHIFSQIPEQICQYLVTELSIVSQWNVTR